MGYTVDKAFKLHPVERHTRNGVNEWFYGGEIYHDLDALQRAMINDIEVKIDAEKDRERLLTK